MGRGYFWPFRLLVAAIFGLTVLVIIISAIHYFASQELKASEQRLMEGFASALASPTTPDKPEYGLVVRKELKLVSGIYSVKPFARMYNMPEECIRFQSHRSIFKVIDEKTLKAERTDKIDVFFQCVLEDLEECPIVCYISIGGKPEISS